MKILSSFKFERSSNDTQHVATPRNRVAKRAQHVGCCAQQCCDMLRLNVVTVWPGFYVYDWPLIL